MLYKCRVIKITSAGRATNITSSSRWTCNEESFQGLWLLTKSREAKDEVHQENKFSPASSPLPLRERFTSRVMIAHNNNRNILLCSLTTASASNQIYHRTKLLSACCLVLENSLSSLNYCASFIWSTQFIAVRDKGFWGQWDRLLWEMH